MKRVKDSFEELFGGAGKVYTDDTIYTHMLGRWLMELALMLDWHKPSSPKRPYPEVLNDDDFCALTGIAPYEEPEEESGKPARAKSAVQWKSVFKRQIEKLKKSGIDRSLPFFGNIALFADMLKLGRAEQFLLTFAASISVFPLFRGAISNRNLGTTNQLLHSILSNLSGIPKDEFQIATSEEGMLVSSGLVRISSGLKDLESKLELMKSASNAMLSPHRTKEELAGRFLKKAPSSTLSLANFPHLETETALIAPYLKGAIENRATGVNILMHGRPGVGKSEYVQLIAKELGLELYEISFADSDGDPIKGIERLQSYAFCQNLLARDGKAMLIFDEIEDVFPGNRWEDDNRTALGKAWVNRTMERNPVPALWVSNRIRQIDPAFLRRFDYSVQFPTPPASVRLSIAQHHLGCFNPPTSWLERIAAAEEITPAQLERAAKVAHLAATPNSLKLVEQVLEKSCKLLNAKIMPTRLPPRTGYSLEYLNLDIDVEALLAGLKIRPGSTLCFYGPAGTGKSELARHIADQVGKPLLMKRASDILGMYVGESEQNIAEMFAEARQQGAVLVLDEADSFLSDRREAQRSWEVTQVNELLTQMETFDGTFICTTNLMERLDQASLRRFAFKVKFDYLTKPQRVSMFRQELSRLGGDVTAADSYEPQVIRLDRLTPGDFAVAVRQFELWGTAATARKLYEQLAKECEAKGAPLRKIGFGA